MNQWLPLSNEDAKASYLKKLSWACNEAKPVEPSAHSKMLSRCWHLVLMALREMVMQFSTSPSFIIQSKFNKNLLSTSMYGYSASHYQYKKILAPESSFTMGRRWCGRTGGPSTSPPLLSVLSLLWSLLLVAVPWLTHPIYLWLTFYELPILMFLAILAAAPSSSLVCLSGLFH